MKNLSKMLSLPLEMSLKVFFHFSLLRVRRYVSVNFIQKFQVGHLFFIVAVRIVYDKDSGRARGFGFVILSNEDDAKDAMDPKVGY
jgi:RNA recognition motif-containing protein